MCQFCSPSIFTVVQNAFSALGSFGLNFYSMFVPDLLHEFELGVWKAIFTHLMRILYASGGNAVQKLNERQVLIQFYVLMLTLPASYRQVPTFGRDTIRRFHKNASAMKKLAARDFEDLLQVRPFLNSISTSITDTFSVPSPFLRASFLSRITDSSSTSSLYFVHGTPLPNSAYIPRRRWNILTLPLHPSASYCDVSNRLHAVSFTRMNYHLRKLREGDARQLLLQSGPQLALKRQVKKRRPQQNHRR